jgi:hypothetical protein
LPANAPPPAQYGAQRPPAKKSKALTYVLVGCGGLLVLVLAIGLALGLFVKSKVGEFKDNPEFAAAKLLVSMNPKLDLLEANERTGELKIRNKETGKTVKVNFRDIKEGHISFEDESGGQVDIQTKGEGDSGSMTVTGPDGNLRFGSGAEANIPTWVPKFPGGQVEGTFAMQGGKQTGGTFQIKCNASPNDVAAYYEREMKGAGMKIQKHTAQMDEGTTVVVVGENPSDRRTVSASAASSGTGSIVTVIYGLKD